MIKHWGSTKANVSAANQRPERSSFPWSAFEISSGVLKGGRNWNNLPYDFLVENKMHAGREKEKERNRRGDYSI